MTAKGKHKGIHDWVTVRETTHAAWEKKQTNFALSKISKLGRQTHNGSVIIADYTNDERGERGSVKHHN